MAATGRLVLTRLDVRSCNQEWGDLSVEAGNLFATPEWMTTWWRHYGSDKHLLATACRSESGQLLGVLPLYTWVRRPLHIVRFMGGGQGDALGPICRPEDRPAVAQGLTRLLRESDIALLIGEYLPRDEGWCDLVGASVVKREPSPTIALEGETWDTFLSSRTKRFRYQIRAKEKKLAADHRLDYRLADDPERFDDDLDLLFELHRARWPLGSSFSNAEAFQREFASVAFERGWCRLWFLEVDGEARAAYYGFRFADVDYAYQAGWDPDWSAYSLGFLLDAHVIREAVRNRVRELRLLRGGEGWKYRLATHDPGLETLGIPGSTAGSAVLQAARRLPRSVLRSIARTGAAITLPATVLIASVSFG